MFCEYKSGAIYTKWSFQFKTRRLSTEHDLSLNVHIFSSSHLCIITIGLFKAGLRLPQNIRESADSWPQKSADLNFLFNHLKTLFWTNQHLKTWCSIDYSISTCFLFSQGFPRDFPIFPGIPLPSQLRPAAARAAAGRPGASGHRSGAPRPGEKGVVEIGWCMIVSYHGYTICTYMYTYIYMYSILLYIIWIIYIYIFICILIYLYGYIYI